MSKRSFDRSRNAEFGIPPGFSTSEVLSHLSRPQRLAELPATAILEEQLARVAKHVRERHPRLSDVDQALAITRQFFQVGLYQRICEQTIFGPKEHERSENVRDLQRVMPLAQAQLRRAAEYIATKRGALKDRRFELDPDDAGWMYFTQENRGKTAYRIYLCPKAELAAGIFFDLAGEIPASVGYQMKTFSPALDRPEDFGRADKVIVYASEETLPALLKAVETVYGRHQEAFIGQRTPGGGVYAPAEGVSIIRNPERRNGTKVTGTEEMAHLIEETLKEKGVASLQGIVQKSFQTMTPTQFRHSVIGEMMWRAITRQGEWMNESKVARWPSLEKRNRSTSESVTEDDQDLTRFYYEAFYTEWVLSLRYGAPIDTQRVQRKFIQRMKQEMVLHYPYEQRLKERDAFYAVVWPGGAPNIEAATRQVLLSASIYRRMKEDQPVEEALGANLQGVDYVHRPAS